MYKGITKNQDRMDRLKFRDVLHNSFAMTDDMIMDRGYFRKILAINFYYFASIRIHFREKINAIKIYCSVLRI